MFKQDCNLRPAHISVAFIVYIHYYAQEELHFCKYEITMYSVQKLCIKHEQWKRVSLIQIGIHISATLYTALILLFIITNSWGTIKTQSIYSS
jgi:hypothetical protein